MAQLEFITRIGYSNVNTLADDESAFFYQAGLAVDADGGPHAYHPDGKSGLDNLGNAGRPGKWWALVTDNGKPGGNPVIQTASDPAPGFYVSTTSLEDAAKPAADPRRYVNAEVINYFVLPSKPDLGATVGDFGVIIRPATGVWDYAIFGDVGPANQIGEASIASAQALGLSPSPRTGGTAHGIVYIVFPGSKTSWPLTQEQIDQQASALFANWGGMAKAKDCFSDMTWAS